MWSYYYTFRPEKILQPCKVVFVEEIFQIEKKYLKTEGNSEQAPAVKSKTNSVN